MSLKLKIFFNKYCILNPKYFSFCHNVRLERDNLSKPCSLSRDVGKHLDRISYRDKKTIFLTLVDNSNRQQIYSFQLLETKSILYIEDNMYVVK